MTILLMQLNILFHIISFLFLFSQNKTQAAKLTLQPLRSKASPQPIKLKGNQFLCDYFEELQKRQF